MFKNIGFGQKNDAQAPSPPSDVVEGLEKKIHHVSSSKHPAMKDSDDLLEGSKHQFFTFDRKEDINARFAKIEALLAKVPELPSSDQIKEGAANLFFKAERVVELIMPKVIGLVGDLQKSVEGSKNDFKELLTKSIGLIEGKIELHNQRLKDLESKALVEKGDLSSFIKKENLNYVHGLINSRIDFSHRYSAELATQADKVFAEHEAESKKIQNELDKKSQEIVELRKDLQALADKVDVIKSTPAAVQSTPIIAPHGVDEAKLNLVTGISSEGFTLREAHFKEGQLRFLSKESRTKKVI